MPSVFVFLNFFYFFLQFFQSNNTNSQYTSLQTHFQSINIVWEPSKGISTQSFTRRFSTILPKKKPPKCWHSSKHVTTYFFVFPPQLHLYYTKLWRKNEKIRSSQKAAKCVWTQSFTWRFSTILPNLRRLTLSWPNFGSRGPFEVFKKRKTIRIEFPKDLARLQTPQTMFRGSKTPTRPRNINKSKNRSFFERFQGPPGSPWSLSKVVIC